MTELNDAIERLETRLNVDHFAADDFRLVLDAARRAAVLDMPQRTQYGFRSYNIDGSEHISWHDTPGALLQYRTDVPEWGPVTRTVYYGTPVPYVPTKE